MPNGKAIALAGARINTQNGAWGSSEPPAWAREVPKDILMIDASEEIGCALEVRGNAPENRGWRRGVSAIPAQKE